MIFFVDDITFKWKEKKQREREYKKEEKIQKDLACG